MKHLTRLMLNSAIAITAVGSIMLAQMHSPLTMGGSDVSGTQDNESTTK